MMNQGGGSFMLSINQTLFIALFIQPGELQSALQKQKDRNTTQLPKDQIKFKKMIDSNSCW